MIIVAMTTYADDTVDDLLVGDRTESTKLALRMRIELRCKHRLSKCRLPREMRANVTRGTLNDTIDALEQFPLRTSIT